MRWLGPVNIGGNVQDALFCHPESSAAYRIAAKPGDRIGAFAALLPDVWQKNAGGVTFSIQVSTAEEFRTESRLTIDPGRRPADRRWRRLSVRVPVVREQDVVVVLSTSVPPGAAPDHAWAVWGAPGLERPRPFAELWSDVRRALGRGRHQAGRHRAPVENRALTAGELERMRVEAGRLAWQPLISVITPVYNTDPRWLRACVESVRRQAYPRWELCLCDDASTSAPTRAVLEELERQADPRIRVVRLDHNSHISAASNAALAAASGEFIALLDHDDELTPDALFEAASHINRFPETGVLYSDEDKLDPDGGCSDPYFKPDWSPEHLLSAMYTSHLTVARRALVEQVGGFRVGYEGSQDHDLALRLSDVVPSFHHVPKVLYHWRRAEGSTASAGAEKPWAQDAGMRALRDWLTRRHIAGTVESGGVPGVYRVRFAVVGEPLVSVVIVGTDRDAAAARACAERLRQSTTYTHLEIIGGDEPIDPTPGGVNAAARSSSGTHLIFLDAALDPADPEWATALLEYSQQDAIGAVGAKIHYADSRLRHIGLWLDGDSGIIRPSHGEPAASYGYFSAAIGVRNYSAVSGECLMTKRTLFDQLGGFDERLPWSVADVDYCLKVCRSGRRVVFTPYARLARRAGAPQGASFSPAGAMAALRRSWGNRLRDPYYSAALRRAIGAVRGPTNLTIDIGLDEPTFDAVQDPLNVRLEGWFDAGDQGDDVRAIEVYDQDNLLGQSEVFFPRPDASRSDGRRRSGARGFSMRLNAPSLVGRRSATLAICVRSSDGALVDAAAAPITLVARDYRGNHYGQLVDAKTTYVLHRANIYGSGPCPYSVGEASPECMALLRRHLGAPPVRLLDIGCGSGAYGAVLRSEGYDWLGVEVKAADCEALARQGLPHRQVDGRTLPFGDASFERAICIEVLEHIETPEFFLAEIRRVVRGRLLVSVPNAELIPYLQDRGVVPWHLLEGDHKNFFNRASLRVLLSGYFRRVEVLTYGRLPIPTSDGLPLDVHLFAICDA